MTRRYFEAAVYIGRTAVEGHGERFR